MPNDQDFGDRRDTSACLGADRKGCNDENPDQGASDWARRTDKDVKGSARSYDRY